MKLKNWMQTRAGAFNSITGKAKKVGWVLARVNRTVTNEWALALAPFGWRNSSWQPYAPRWRVKLTIGDWIGDDPVAVPGTMYIPQCNNISNVRLCLRWCGSDDYWNANRKYLTVYT